jgi:predicted ATPase
MIRRIETLNYRCLRNLKLELAPFQILVGPNASGKTTFLDTVRFIGQLVSSGLENAVRDRTENIRDLFWRQEGDRFELAVETSIPEDRRDLLEKPEFSTCRFEIAIGVDPDTQEDAILAERLVLMSKVKEIPATKELFPHLPPPPSSILTKTGSKRIKTVVNKVSKGNDNFYDETGKGWDHAFKLGPRKSALGNLPEDETRFPVSTWFKRIISEGIDTLVLNSAAMRKPSPPGQPKGFRPDGSNLPWTIEYLRQKNKREFDRWISHVRTALPDLKTIETVERPEDKHRYLQVVYENGLKVPSWAVSDGTLRLLALTLLAYIGDPGKVFLIEEPENGIHPQAVETVFQSLDSAYDSQILCATHSPVILSMAEPEQVLCFSRTDEGATDVVQGNMHPNLRDWKRGADLGTLFASGVLGQ